MWCVLLVSEVPSEFISEEGERVPPLLEIFSSSQKGIFHKSFRVSLSRKTPGNQDGQRQSPCAVSRCAGQ